MVGVPHPHHGQASPDFQRTRDKKKHQARQDVHVAHSYPVSDFPKAVRQNGTNV